MVSVRCKYNPEAVFEIVLKRPRYTGEQRARNYIVLRCRNCKLYGTCKYRHKGRVRMNLYVDVFGDVPSST